MTIKEKFIKKLKEQGFKDTEFRTFSKSGEVNPENEEQWNIFKDRAEQFLAGQLVPSYTVYFISHEEKHND